MIMDEKNEQTQPPTLVTILLLIRQLTGQTLFKSFISIDEYTSVYLHLTLYHTILTFNNPREEGF